MANLSKAEKLKQLQARIEEKNAKNRMASRRSRSKSKAKAQGVTYAEYVKEHFDMTIEQFESLDYKSSARKMSGVTMQKGTPEYDEYNRRASRKSKMKTLLEIAEVTHNVQSIEQFVEQFTEATDVDEFYSDAYNQTHKGCYAMNAYPTIKETLA